VRRSVAEYLQKEQGAPFTENEIIMTCGAGGGLNVVLKAILNPGEVVLCPSPYFVEYVFYVDNHGGSLETVPTTEEFDIDVDRLASAITPNTAAVLINSPNNPTGRVYSAGTIGRVAAMLREKSREYSRPIYLVSDEPYRKIAFDGIAVPSIPAAYENSIVVHSYSKDLSLAGERIGFIAVNPKAEDARQLIGAMILANRILGFVNAPASVQQAVGRLQGVSVDTGIYERRRDLLCDGLASIGYTFTRPQGAFYLFPSSPIEDDVKFCGILQEEKVLAVPGCGFGSSGHFRLAFCVDDAVIERAMPAFRRAWDRV
jgi:aspartate aminotransferase